AAIQRLPAHEKEAEEDRDGGAEQQVDDRLRDRQVERAEVDRDPFVLDELLRRVELALRERARRGEERECNRDEQDAGARHRAAPKYESSESPSSNVYASAYVTIAPTAISLLATAAASSTARSPIDLKKSPNACTPVETVAVC